MKYTDIIKLAAKDQDKPTAPKKPAPVKNEPPEESTWMGRNKDWLIGTGVGALTGTAAYSLGDMVPQLKRRRLLRLLIGLGVGTATGVGTGLLIPTDKEG